MHEVNKDIRGIFLGLAVITFTFGKDKRGDPLRCGSLPARQNRGLEIPVREEHTRIANALRVPTRHHDRIFIHRRYIAVQHILNLFLDVQALELKSS